MNNFDCGRRVCVQRLTVQRVKKFPVHSVYSAGNLYNSSFMRLFMPKHEVDPKFQVQSVVRQRVFDNQIL